MNEQIARAARDLKSAKKVVALTGAGISVESGIPPFRGKGGLWEKIDPMEFAHIDAFLADPAKVWQVLIKDMKEVLDRARPNDGHKGLARLEKAGILTTVITQNVDGLHQAAGNADVIEFHGNFAWQSCLECRCRIATQDIDMGTMPPRCACGGILRPECVFFGEMIPPQALLRSQQAAATCDLMLVVGTSATVYPVAAMPVIAKQHGARIIEINPEPTPLTHSTSDYLIKAGAGAALNAVLAAMDLSC